ncbi:MAG: transposase [Sarcina sp.]
MARPSKYETEVKDKLFLIECWARDGYTNEDIAGKLGIGMTSFYEYQNKYVEFANAIKRGKEVVDYEVENMLLKRAFGYEYDEVTYENGEETKRITKQVAPDTTAQIFWLKNRKPKEWRDKREYNIEADVTKSELTPEERKKRIEALRSKLNDK